MRSPPFSGQKGEDEYKRYFTQNAPKQASFAEATRQAIVDSAQYALNLSPCMCDLRRGLRRRRVRRPRLAQ
jgi:hypothetical protein